MKTARDLMVRLQDYPHARQTQTLAEAAKLLASLQIKLQGSISMPRVLLVLDEDNQLLGSVRRRDILRGLEPEFHDQLETAHPEAHVRSQIDPNLTELIPALDPARLAGRLSKPITSVLHELRGSVDIDDSLMKIVRELVGKDTHIAAVLEDGIVVGVVRSLDVLRAVCEPLD